MTLFAGAGPEEQTGTVTCTFYKGGDDCETGTLVGSYDVGMNPRGTVENSPVQSALAEGLYAFTAYYHGDENFIATGGACEPIAVTSVAIGEGVPELLQYQPPFTRCGEQPSCPESWSRRDCL